MLVNLQNILKAAAEGGSAVPCFNVPNFEMARAAVDAASELSVPVIIGHVQVHDGLIPIENIGPQTVEYAKRASAPVCVHLDHGIDMSFVMRGIRCGYSSIMYDCSDLPFEENVTRIREFTEAAHEMGLSVEAELGTMSSTAEDSHGGPRLLGRDEIKKTFTDPDMAAEFAERTGVDALAVCFGTVHGIYAEEPMLDIARVREIRSKMPKSTRLVMHGGSGVDQEQVAEAIKAGITKINYHSYWSKAASMHVYEKLKETQGDMFYHEVQEEAYRKLKEDAKEVLLRFRGGRD